MRKIYIIYDYEMEIIGILSDKFYKDKSEVIEAAQDLADQYPNSNYWTWTEVEEHILKDTFDQLIRKE